VKAQPRKERALFQQVAAPGTLDGGEQNRFRVAIKLVADNRVTKRGKVHAYLVNPASFRQGFKDTVISGAPQKSESCHCFLAPELVNNGEMPLVPVRDKAQVANGFLPGRPPINYRDITFFDFPVFKSH